MSWKVPGSGCEGYSVRRMTRMRENRMPAPGLCVRQRIFTINVKSGGCMKAEYNDTQSASILSMVGKEEEEEVSLSMMFPHGMEINTHTHNKSYSALQVQEGNFLEREDF